MAGILAQILIAHLDSVFAGPNGDYPAVLEALDGLTASQAAWKPAVDCNSIWQIVEHVTASKLWQIDMLEKGEAASPVWTEPSGREVDWQAALARLHEVHARLKDTLSRLSDDELLSLPEPAWNKTLMELALSLAAHEAHHSGQIDYLRGLQAAQGSE